MQAIQEDEFSRLLWDIHALPHDVDLRKHFGKEFNIVFPNLVTANKEKANVVARYVIYMYDKRTPLRKFFPRINDRREQACRLAGYSHGNVSAKNKRWLIDGVDPVIVNAAFNFVKYQNDPLLASLVTNEINFWQYQKELSNPTLGGAKSDPTTKFKALELKSKLMKESETIRQRIGEFEDELFGGDEQMIEKVREVRRIMATSPEAMAV